MEGAWRVADLPVDRCWVHCGHALYLAQDIDYGREPRALWHVYYRPRPLSPLDRNPLKRVREVQHLASDPDWAEAIRLAETMVGAGQIQAAPDTEQTRIKADSLDREAGIAGFVAPEELARLDVVPFRYDSTRPPLPEHGLQIGRDDAGTWRTYQYRYPTSTLTAGHASNAEAYWACHSLRSLAAWSTTIDIRDAVEGEPQWCRFDREDLVSKVDQVQERYARWRNGPERTSEPDLVREVRDVPGLRLERFGRGAWRVMQVSGGWSLIGEVGSEAKAREAARQLAELADWSTLPPYVITQMPALTSDTKGVASEALGLLDAAERERTWAKEYRAKVAADAAKAAAWRRR